MIILLKTKYLLRERIKNKLSFINKVYLKVLWFKKTHSFIWAHKPLCEKFSEDVIKIKKIHLCRSCFFTYSGMLTTGFTTLFLPSIYLEFCNYVLFTLVAFTLPLSYPTLYKRLPRKLRDIIRLMLGSMISLTVYALIKGDILLALGIFLLSCIFWRVYFTQRSKRKLNICHACGAYAEHQVCPGFEQQAELIREYEKEATNYLIKTGYVPKILKKFR